MFILKKGAYNARLIFCCVAMLNSSACASQPIEPSQIYPTLPTESSPSQQPEDGHIFRYARSRLIAADFVSTLKNTKAFDDAEMVFTNPQPTSEFGDRFLQALSAAGYDHKWNDAPTSKALSFRIDKNKKLTMSGNRSYTFMVGIGDLEMKREYEVLARGVKPIGRMLVRGVPSFEGYIE